MTIRHLKIFDAVCLEMNMSRAAAKLYISQSAVSQAIQELEQEYGVRLFERLSKKLYLTEAGRRLLSHAQQVLYAVEQLEQGMGDLSAKAKLRIGAATTVGACLIHPLLEVYQQRCPQVEVTAEIANSGRLEELVLCAQLDLAILQDRSQAQEVVSRPVFEDRLVFLCPAGHPLSGQQIPLERLAAEPFVLREQGSGTRRLLEDLFRERGLPLVCGWVCPGAQATKAAVAHGRGLTLISQLLVREELAEGRFGVVPVEGVSLTRQFQLICHKNKYITPALDSFLTLCADRPLVERLLEQRS